MVDEQRVARDEDAAQYGDGAPGRDAGGERRGRRRGEGSGPTTPELGGGASGAGAAGAGPSGTPSTARTADTVESRADGAAGTTGRGTPGATGGGPTSARGDQDRPSRLGWVALTGAVVLLVWQLIYAVIVVGPGLDGAETYTSAWLLISLVLAVGAAVLGIVAVSQRVRPRWPATVGLAVGSYVFLVCLATWAGTLMTATG